MRIRKSKENLPGSQISQPTYKGSLTERFPNWTAAPKVPMTSLAMHFEGERHLEGWMTETGSMNCLEESLALFSIQLRISGWEGVAQRA